MNAPDTTRQLERGDASHLFDRDFGAHTEAVERTALGQWTGCCGKSR